MTEASLKEVSCNVKIAKAAHITYLIQVQSALEVTALTSEVYEAQERQKVSDHKLTQNQESMLLENSLRILIA